MNKCKKRPVHRPVKKVTLTSSAIKRHKKLKLAACIDFIIPALANCNCLVKICSRKTDLVKVYFNGGVLSLNQLQRGLDV